MRMMGVVAAASLLLASCGSPRERPAPRIAGKHVLLLHLDGYRSDLVRTLLRSGRLPHLEELVARGRISYQATTVDKSETFKVIQSLLTSQLDTTVTGWWHFDRSAFRFSNYWLDPAEVLRYKLGLEFPRSPTIQDFLAARGQNLVAGMSLARRSVPFENYGRAYLEGIAAVSTHTYLEQAHATMGSFLDIHRRIAEEGEQPPALSTLVLAAADEFSHWEGVTTASASSEHCFVRDDGDVDDAIFRLLEEDQALRDLEARYFTLVRRSTFTRRVEQICFELPEIEGRRAEPRYVLSMLLIDIELGYLFTQFRDIRFGPAETLMSRTLFVVFGDHGMVDTPNEMADRAGGESFITYLNRRLGLDTGQHGTALPEDVELGIDYLNLPRRLREPESYTQWQSEDVRDITTEAHLWAQEFLLEARELLRNDLHESYWWLFFLRSLLVDPKLDGALGPVTVQTLAAFRNLHLRGRPDYRAAESAANREFFDRQVRLVYGGAARNNAELFIPVCNGEACSWGRRPTYDEILAYRDGALVNALVESPGVGHIFIRTNNEVFDAGAPLPARLHIEVRDREGNRGGITVRRDEHTKELVFHYRTEPSSEADPLGYGEWGAGEGTYGTYNEWNDRTINESYVNVVGGIGAYLYSSNPSIGDILVMHASQWNFGDNVAGHGGVHRDEKRTILLVSGPEVRAGELRARARFRTTPEGNVVPAADGNHVPTLLDVTPTALRWLGYSAAELDRFGEEEFEAHLDGWIRSQHADFLAHLGNMSSVEKVKDQARVPELSLDPLMPRFSRLLDFVAVNREETLEALEPRAAMGNELILQ